MAERLGAADVAKLGKLAEEPSLLSKKLAEGVFSGIGSNSPDPLPPRVRRYYLAVAFATVAAGLVVSCFIAGASKQIDWTWAICGIAVGLLLTVLATLDALEKRIPFIDNTGPIAVGIAAATWLLIGWQTWIVFHSPTQGYTQAQLDGAVTKALDPVQKTLDAEIKQRNAAVTAEQNANRQLAQLTQSHAQIFPFPQAFGTTCALNLTSIASAFWDRAPEGAGVLITAAPGNDELKRNLLGTFSIAWSKHVQSDPKRFDNNKSRMFLDGPNNAVDIDAPRLAASDKNGVIIHGGDPQETFRTGWINYFVVRHTSKVPEGLAEYYKVPSIVWIEIGPGDPWTRPFSCSAG
ncbi:hypothetical protein [Bradyrhizobium sp. SZCCHNRI3052]|uniref:hypothetical protein n=1 Tax=Bradyrhizobium sp. SZCCHNRI3052 TaxID=3057295 RepID=UPI0029166D92|nr:hypothetical protein [Bradyrhizobium sp. SZCCHNRI3052]